MSIREFATSIETTPLSMAMKSIGWMVPTLQSVHIVMVGVVFVSVLMVTLRVLGWMRADEPLTKVWSRFAPFLWVGIAVMVVTGVLLAYSEPLREFMSLSFRLKMLLLVVGVVSAALFGRSMRGAARAAAATGGEAPLPAGVRMAALATLALWIAIIFLGRAIAYDDAIWGNWSPAVAQQGGST